MKRSSLLITISLFSGCLFNSAAATANEYQSWSQENGGNYVRYTKTKPVKFKKQICSRNRYGNILGCANIATTSNKNHTTWQTSSGNGSAWGTHTSKINTSEIVEEHYPKN